MSGKRIACLGDSSDHGGEIITHNQDGTVFITRQTNPESQAGGGEFGTMEFGGISYDDRGFVEYPAVDKALHSCPIPGHGITEITAITTKSYINKKLILTKNAVAGCGAKITPSDRKVYVE